MKRVFQIVFFVFVSLAAFALEKQDSIQSKFFVGIGASSTYAFPSYKFLNLSDSYNKSNLKYGGTLLIHYCFKKNLSIKSGIAINFLEYKIISIKFPETYYEIQNYSLASIPFNLNISFGKKKIYYEISMGLQSSFLVENNIYYALPGTLPPIFDKQLYKNGSFILLPTIGFGGKYNITNRYSIFIQSEIFKAMIPLKYFWHDSSTGEDNIEINYLKYWKTSFGVYYNF